jgi:hypothetical protein
MTDNVAIAGIPRAGTTLVCGLLATLPDVAALDEPLDPAAFQQRPRNGHAASVLDSCFREARASIAARGMAPSLGTRGRLADNHFGGGRRIRPQVIERGEIDVESADVLAIKQPAVLTTYLQEVRDSFATYAIVRNPLALLASWNTVDAQVRDGRLAIGEAGDSSLGGRLEGKDRVARQLELLSWFFEQYRRFLPSAAVLRYEDVVATGGDALSAITPSAATLAESLENRNDSYDGVMMRRLASRLLESDGAYWDYYDRQDVEALT